MSTDNFGALGSDFFIKTYNKGSTMSQADLDALVQYVQLTTTILAIGDFTADEQDSVWMILERTDVNTAPGYTVTNNTDVTMTSGGLVTINSLPWSKITGKPSFFSGDYNDLTNKPTIPSEVSLGDFTFSVGDASLPAGNTMTLSTYRSGANEESKLTLSPTTESSLYAAGVLKLGTGYGSGSEQYWQFGANGDLTIPGDIKDSTGASVLGGSNGPTNEITNTEPSSPSITNPSIYSVSVGTDGVITMVTARGNIEFGAQPEVGGPSHLHIMRPAGQEGATDLFFGDDYNYVKLPAAYGAGTQGVEIGSSYSQGTVSTWRFNPNGILTFPNAGGGTDLGSQSQDGTFIISNPGNIILNNSGGTWTFGADGHLILPTGGDIRDITGTSVLGGGGSANTGNISFSGDEITGTAGVAKMQVLDVMQTASYSFTPGVDYSTAVWENDYITFNDPTQAIYDAIWALTTGSSTPGMPLAPTLFINQTAVGGPLNIDIVDITINQGTTSYVEIDGTDFRVDVQDDIRMYANDAFRFINRSTTNGIEIQTADGDHIWEFNPDGTLTLPSSGDILRNGTSVIPVIPNLALVATTGIYNDLSDRPNLLYRQVNAPVTSKGQPGDQLNDIAFDNLYVYYCVAYYSDGVADIWKRVAFSIDTW
jgi:hypothetical protein